MAREAGNTEDRFAVAITKDDMVVGHVPREFSKLCWHFLRHGLYRRQTPSPHENYHECVKLYLGSHAVRCYRICAYALNKL